MRPLLKMIEEEDKDENQLTELLIYAEVIVRSFAFRVNFWSQSGRREGIM
jgi:hypothetical protein